MSSRRTSVPWDKATAGEVADWLGMLKAPRVPAVPAIKEGADDEAWLAARDAGVGASDIGVIMGLSKFSSPYALWWQKHLRLRLPGTDQTDDGHTLEPIVAQEFAQRHPEIMLTTPSPRLWVHRDHPWALCTPDRLGVMYGPPHIMVGPTDPDTVRELRAEIPRSAVHDPAVVPVELKWDASPGWGTSGTQDVPEQYALQVMWQAWILGAPGGWLVNHKPSGRNRYREYWIPVDQAVIDRAFAHGNAFVVSLETGVSPDPDGSKATEEVLRTINADFSPDEVADVPPLLAAAWQEAKAEKAAAGARERELSNRLREAMGRAGVAVDAATGAVIARRNVYKRTGYEVGPAVIDELRMVTDDGGRGPGRGVPEADGEEGSDPGAGTPRPEEGRDGDAAGVGGAEQGAGAEAAGAAGGGYIVTVDGLTDPPVEPDPGCAPPLLVDTRAISLTTTMLLREARASVALDGETISVGPVTVGEADEFGPYLAAQLEDPEVRAAYEDELADPGGVIPASPELVALGDALKQAVDQDKQQKEQQ